MAVTFLGGPDSTLTPSDNPVTWWFSSDQTAQANFAFLVRVYVNGVLKQNHYPLFPENNGTTLHFDASDAAMLACSPPVPKVTLDDGVAADAANYAQISIEVCEYYGTPATLQSTSTEQFVNVYKACLSDYNFTQWSSQDYYYAFPVHGPPRVPKWLTLWPNRPLGNKYYCGMTEQLFGMFVNGNQDLDLRVDLFDADDNLIVSDAITTGSGDWLITIYNLSPKSIAANSGVISLADFTNCAYYNCYVDDYSASGSESFRVYIDRSCDTYGTKRLHYLSSIGSMESFSFTKANEKGRDIIHNGYETNWGRYNGDGNFEYSVYQGREKDHRNTSVGNMKISSDWIKEINYNFLGNELLESPYVFLEQLETVVTDVSTITTFYKRVKVTNTKFDEKQKIKDGLFQLVVELNTSDARKTALIN